MGKINYSKKRIGLAHMRDWLQSKEPLFNEAKEKADEISDVKIKNYKGNKFIGIRFLNNQTEVRKFVKL